MTFTLSIFQFPSGGIQINTTKSWVERRGGSGNPPRYSTRTSHHWTRFVISISSAAEYEFYIHKTDQSRGTEVQLKQLLISASYVFDDPEKTTSMFGFLNKLKILLI